jgi:hypothetical protein
MEGKDGETRLLNHLPNKGTSIRRSDAHSEHPLNYFRWLPEENQVVQLRLSNSKTPQVCDESPLAPFERTIIIRKLIIRFPWFFDKKRMINTFPFLDGSEYMDPRKIREIGDDMTQTTEK